MAVLVGIDEAGYGPILGPLVVSSISFLVPEELMKADLWQELKKSIANKRTHLRGRLLIADSKKVFNKSAGIKHLERSVLTILRCLGKEPETLPELLELLCPGSLERLSSYPWHRDNGISFQQSNIPDRKVAAKVLADDMASSGIKLIALNSRCLDVGYYNKMVLAVRNKAEVLFTSISQLIKQAYDSFAGKDLHIIVDRLGGRVRYREGLQRMFSDMELRILQESPSASSYELRNGGKTMQIQFIVGADDKFLPVSLASMTSKYLRELLMEQMNRYFTALDANLRPTAGYWKDGLRFIEDLKVKLPQVNFDSSQLIRCR
jgi:ribonuclease HII